MANKQLRFVALLAVMLVLACALVACTTTTQPTATYNVIIHQGEGQENVTWDRQSDVPTLTKEGFTFEGLYLDAEYTSATTWEDLKAMWLTQDIDVYVKWEKIIYKITVHPANGEQDVIWEPASGNKAPVFTKTGYIMDGFYFDENCTQSADSVFTQELIENKEVWVKWSECDHKAVTSWIEDTKPTCTEAGHKTATCPTCQKELEDTIQALGHELTHHTKVDATCTADGTKEYWSCGTCNKNFADDKGTTELKSIVIPKIDHSYTTLKHDETHHWYECACGAEKPESRVAHTWDEGKITKPATEDEEGVKTFTCTCGHTKTEPVAKLEHTHTWGDVDYAWSQDDKGNWICTATRVCSKDSAHKEVKTAALDNGMLEATVTQEQSCENDELTTYTTKFNAIGTTWAQEQTKADVVTKEKLGHVMEWVNTDEEKHWQACQHEGCTHKTDATDHTWDAGDVKKEPSIEGDGLTIYTCTTCGRVNEVATKWDHTHTYDESKWVYDENGHWHASTCGCGSVVKGEYEAHKGGEATCTAKAICDVCGQAYGSLKQHTYGEWVEETPATCHSKGEKGHYYCSECKLNYDKYGNVIEDLEIGYESHNLKDVPAVDPTCTTGGNKAYKACQNEGCGYTTLTKEEYTLSALGHNTKDGHHALEPATCENDGLGEYWYCATCKKYFTDEACKNETTKDKLTLGKLGHEYGEVTYSWNGIECTATRTCANNTDHVEKETVTAVATSIKQALSCDKDKIEVYTATFANKAFETQTKDVTTQTATGHEWNDVEYTWNADYTELTAKRVCKNDANHVETESTKAITSQITQNHSCTQAQITTYTAIFENAKFATKQTKEVVTKEASHTFGDLVGKVDATCTTDGKEAHYQCSVCKAFFNENKEPVEESALVISAGHNYGDLIAAIPAIGTQAGTKSHYHCDKCSKDFDADKNEVSADDLVIAVTKDAFISEIFIANYADTNSWKNATQYKNVANAIFTATASGTANTGKYYEDGENWRIYTSESGKVTIKVEEGYKLTSVKIEYTKKNSPIWKYDTTQITIETGVRVQALGNEIMFSTSGSGNIQITKIIVGYDYTSDEAKANAIGDSLSLSGNYSEDFDLPTTNVEGATITWESNNSCVTFNTENNKALVAKPESNQEVTLTATIKVGSATVTRSFNVNILAQTEQFVVTITAPEATQGTLSATIGETTVESGNSYDKGSVLTITATPATGYELVKIMVNGDKISGNTYTIEDAVAISVVFELTHTQDNPYSVEEILASAYIADLTTSGDVTPKQMYVKGIVKAGFVYKTSSSGTTFVSGLTLVDEDDSSKEFLVFSCNWTESVSAIYAGDTVVVYGYIKNYDGTIEMATANNTYPTFIERTVGQGSVTVADDSSANATVSDITPATGENGTTFTFKVSVAEGNTLTDVEVNGVSVLTSYNEEAGTYTGTIVGATLINIETKGDDEPEPQTVYSHTFAKSEIKTTTSSVTLSNVTWDYTSISNVGWDSNATNKGIQLGTGNSPIKSFTLSTTGISSYKTIIINASMANSGDAKLAVYAGNTLIKQYSLTTSNAAYEFTLPSASSEELKIVYTNTKKAAYIKSIEVKA